jgi:hypothetical protein
MKRFLRYLLVSAVFGSAMALGAAPGCADNESSIFIRQAQLPVVGQSGALCTIDSSPTSLFITHGVLDVAFSTQYTAFLLVGNQLVQRGESTTVRTETSRVRLEGSEVYLEDAAGNTAAGPFTVPGSGFVDPAVGDTPGFGLMDSILVDSHTGQALRSQLMSQPRGTLRRFTAHVKAFGTTLGGVSVESGDFTFPIDVCYGCLVSFPPDSSNPALQQPNCSATSTTGGTSFITPCYMGQDTPIDCRLCQQYVGQSADICQPVSSTDAGP